MCGFLYVTLEEKHDAGETLFALQKRKEGEITITTTASKNRSIYYALHVLVMFVIAFFIISLNAKVTHFLNNHFRFIYMDNDMGLKLLDRTMNNIA